MIENFPNKKLEKCYLYKAVFINKILMYLVRIKILRTWTLQLGISLIAVKLDKKTLSTILSHCFFGDLNLADIYAVVFLTVQLLEKCNQDSNFC